MKTCDTCKIPKVDSEFNKNKAKKDGLNSICKECSRKRSRRYYKEKGELHKKNVVKRNKKNRKVLHDYILQHLKNNPCKDCGNDDVRVLEFDHLPEFKKSKDISRLLATSVSITTLQKEMDKCEVVCANCHKIRTVERSKVNYRKDSSTVTSSGIMIVKDNESLEKLLKEMYPNQQIKKVKWTEGPTLRTITFEE